MLISSVLSLSACSANKTIDSENLKTDTASVPTDTAELTNTADITIAHPQNATVDEGNIQIGSIQTETNDIATPIINAASDNETSDALHPEANVACAAPSTHIQQRTLQLINEARSQPRNCGTDSFEATTALSWNTNLLQAAIKHSADMTSHNFFDHTGSDGSSVATRVDETGYTWRAVGENIAAGQDNANEAIAGWLSSPGHCSNLMNPNFTNVAVTCEVDNGADYKQYWTNVLAAPL